MATAARTPTSDASDPVKPMLAYVAPALGGIVLTLVGYWAIETSGKVNSVDTRLQTVEKDLVQVKADVGVLKSDVSQLKTDLAQLKTDVKDGNKETQKKLDDVLQALKSKP